MNNRNLMLGLLVLTFVAFSCKQKDKSDNSPMEEEKSQALSKKESTSDYSKTYDTGSYSITFEANNAEVSVLRITTKGLENEEDDSIEIEGKVLDTYMTDLNEDGYKEFFITVSPTDDSVNLDLIGFASNKGKSLSDIAINEPAELRDVFSDKVIFDANSIVREFESNEKTLKYKYYLTEGEAGYVLTARKEQ